MLPGKRCPQPAEGVGLPEKARMSAWVDVQYAAALATNHCCINRILCIVMGVMCA